MIQYGRICVERKGPVLRFRFARGYANDEQYTAESCLLPSDDRRTVSNLGRPSSAVDEVALEQGCGWISASLGVQKRKKTRITHPMWTPRVLKDTCLSRSEVEY